MRSTLQITGICVLIACVGITTMGVVLAPTSAITAAGEEWYPCIAHGCGCISAQMCRDHCCCYGMRSRDMKPPTRAGHSLHDQRDATPFRVTVQSANCSGRLGWSAGGGLAWDVTPMPGMKFVLVLTFDQVLGREDLYISQNGPSFDPPPPRC